MLIAGRRWLAGGVCVLAAVLSAACGRSTRAAVAPVAGGGPVATVKVDQGLVARRVAGIAGGGFAGYAVLPDGRVWAWGDDFEGQIGSAGGWGISLVPVEVPGLANIVAVAGGENTAYALQRGGAVWAWGDDSTGELGDSGYAPRQTPVRVQVPGAVVAIAAGTFTAFALRRDGTVWAWGDNTWGQLGTSAASATRGTPRPMTRLAGVVAIAAGAGDGYALLRDGTVRAWGDDSLGQLGGGGCGRSSCPPADVPVKVQGLTDVTAIAAGAYTAYALRRDGTVWAWGEGSFGALGTPVERLFGDEPVRVSGLRDVVAIAAGSYSAYAVLRDGTVWAWGRGVEGEIGDGAKANRAMPTRVRKLTRPAEITGGGDAVYAIDRQGQIWAWGNGDYGELGDGYNVSLDEPTGVLWLRALPPPGHERTRSARKQPLAVPVA